MWGSCQIGHHKSCQTVLGTEKSNKIRSLKSIQAFIYVKTWYVKPTANPPEKGITRGQSYNSIKDDDEEDDKEQDDVSALTQSIAAGCRRISHFSTSSSSDLSSCSMDILVW